MTTASDWFLPSRAELNEVCKYARNTGQAAGEDTFCMGGTLRNGFSAKDYWSSSEFVQNVGFYWNFSEGNSGSGYKGYTANVRPVRAF